MVETRRKSRANAARSSPPFSEHGLEVELPEDLDQDTLSALLPDTNIATVTSETVISIYRALLLHTSELDAAQRELDQARAEVERKDVELDQALQDRETISKDLEVSLEDVQNGLNQMQDERDKLATSNAALREQLKTLTSSQSVSSSELESLKSRVEDTEREKRDLVNVISRLKQEGTQQEEEIQNLRSNLKEARQEHQTLEATVRELRSSETSTKFKLETLSQQLDLAQSEVERTNAELSTKSEEFAKYRREKHTEIVSLQAQCDSLTQSNLSAQTTLKALQSSHSSQSHQLTQTLARVQDLTGQLAEQEATYASEASGLRRLVAMMEEREKQAKAIVEGIESEWADVGEKAEKREATLKEEIERERKSREAAEKRVDELETVLDRMNRGELPILGGSPGTPMRTPGGPTDPLTQSMMGLSPTVAMASKAQRSGKTFTEVYADYVRLQEQFAQKCSEYDHMDRTLSAVLAQIEERAPILSQQRAEYERLQSEAAQLSSQLSQALSERDAKAAFAQETSQKLTKSTRENDLLQKQLDDLGRQVQILLKEIARRDDPMIPSDEELEQTPLEPAANIEAVITNNLVLFRSIHSLQSQNQKLLRIVRELGDKLESEERDYKESMQKEQQEAVAEAHEAMKDLMKQLEVQKKSSENIIQAYVKERDTLRIMLAKAEARTGSVNGVSAGINGLHEGVPDMSGDSNAAKELEEVQHQFEAYRTEMSVDSVRLREEVVEAQRESGRLGAELAKAHAKIEFLTDRQRMSQEQSAMHSRELETATKRNQQLYDQWTRMDIECARATEDLQIAHGHLEQLRTECANLRAEKKIWESVQSRLLQENKTLAMERSHLSDLMTNVQKMHNDLERSGENDRRRLESQLQHLESQTQDLRTQVNQERDTVRHITLQKDIELKELHNRIDRSVLELSKTRESLVGAETSKKHLEERVEELTKNLQGSVEKLSVYERRTTTTDGTAPNVDPSLSREQQLEVEVAELRSSLKIVEVDLATARSHVQQFQEISEANEAALASLNGTYDDYRASTEAQIARQDSERAALEEKLKIAQEELLQLRATYAELQKTLESERTAWLNDKKTLEDTIVDMSTSEKSSESDRTSRENEYRQQEQRAKAAEERYSNEVVAHAESIKAIDNLRKELSTAQGTARENATLAETAKANLKASEESWKHQKGALDKEVAGLKARCEDLSSQNAILHQHLESVSSQAARIRQTADAAPSSNEGEAGDDADAKLSELRSVVAYLRKEKEIVDLQLELSKQENARLKTQIDHLSQNLGETRKTLSEERERALEATASASQHAELVERINQLNILRESNATLRADCEAHAKRSRDLEAKLQKLSSELDPAKEQARIARAELEASEAHVKRLQEESGKWKERNSQLLSKYDRIDPAEVQALKDEIEQLKIAKAQLEEAAGEHDKALQDQVQKTTTLEDNLKAHKERHKATVDSARARLATLTSERNTFREKSTALEAERATLQTSLNEMLASGAQASSDSSDQASIIAELRAERDKLKAALDAATANPPAAPAAIDHLSDAEKAEIIKARDEALLKLKEATEQAQKAQAELVGFRRSNEKFQARIQEMAKARAAESERMQAQQAAAVAAAVEKAKAEAQASGSGSSQPSEELAKQHSAELKALEERLVSKHQEELKTALAAAEAAKKEMPAESSTNEAATKDAIAAAISEHDKELQAKHAEEITQAVERGRLELAAKSKLKDAQLIKAQKRVKDLEAQILSWKQAGVLPDAPPTTPVAATGAAAPPPTPVATTQKPPAPGPAKTVPPASTAPVASTSTAPAQNALPRKPAAGATAPGAGRGRALQTAVSAVRGRGGAPARGRGAGNGPARPPPAAAATAAPAKEQISIQGAGKRTREEGEVSGDDSLAKRLKPADSTPSARATPPVQIRRPAPS
ncbi:Protein mlp1 [Pleurotus ostreatus]|uniref:Uncharacterized protein n=1 Tax=Pleurotus cornucopiae TaxID=5321 RepID=A0ACB7JBE5_PLECO|nr:hypothetical protein CCMSSC00406_0004057 [Pleurotus cornucopiae]KAJ8691335.1 Protein mlp1 [Pleurotus ostreatus]